MADNTGTHRDLIKDTVYERFIFTALEKVPPLRFIQAQRQEVDFRICPADAFVLFQSASSFIASRLKGLLRGHIKEKGDLEKRKCFFFFF